MFTADYSKDEIPLASIPEKERFSILFSLLSGRTLIIVTRNSTEKATSLAKKLSILTPFENTMSYRVIQEVTSFGDCLKYSIVVTNDMSHVDNYYGLPICIFDLDTCKMFEDVPCPEKSFVRKLFPHNEKIDNIVLITVYNNLKHTFSKFLIKIAEVSTRTRQTRETMLNALESFQFSPVDEPIFKYWIYSLASSNECRTILLDSDLTK